MERFDPEQIDLAALASHLRAAIGPQAAGNIIGRTSLRDAVAEHLACSQLEAERIVDTMVGRGFLTLSRGDDGQECWEIGRKS
jgi:hypothetical protein